MSVGHYLDKSNDHCQPCESFTPSFDEGFVPHQCPDCGGLRYFCSSCLRDHHDWGWESCAVTDLMRDCRHQKCKDQIARDQGAAKEEEHGNP